MLLTRAVAIVLMTESEIYRRIRRRLAVQKGLYGDNVSIKANYS